MGEKFQALIVSDIHAYDGSGNSEKPPSFYDVASTDNRPETHPLHGVLHLIEKEKVSAQALICLGDIADKAAPHAMSSTWMFLDRIREAAQAHTIIATPGNHDLDSRFYYNKFDAKGHLLSLDPGFPLSDEQQRCKFWTYNFVIHDTNEARFLIINSSAYHGNGKTNETAEFRHGRIADSTIQNIINALSSVEPRDVQIAIFHHHIEKIQWIEDDGYSAIENSYRLLEAFGSGLYGYWTIAHGHMHYPTVRYGSGTSDAPVIFSSGSLCSTLYGHFSTRVRNQLHHLTIAPDVADNLHLPVAGTIKSWTWASGLGWLRSATGDGLPAECGFGYRPNFSELISLLESMVTDRYMRWSEIVEAHPKIGFITPSDLEVLVNRSSKQLGITFDRFGIPFQVDKK